MIFAQTAKKWARSASSPGWRRSTEVGFVDQRRGVQHRVMTPRFQAVSRNASEFAVHDGIKPSSAPARPAPGRSKAVMSWEAADSIPRPA